ncbi:response regulator [Aetokthonos hydrillicola Thurmond2011]|jgi:chemotaxis family two-component system response regulator PixH|uniref:Response regulator n=2 Tax=Aetokthonos TaxID=1550243 RepID=A0AAP5ICT9_9CYAN|nr:response regulator [Aetokthonos hydrillicola]MBO3461451.1 response regulator [Aetokthonos hydrillicola CCALA 1050]MBW4588793.1 response regulator [Aetokthonos hydrillicola CCALA 1050]MDR9897343.1 response regulator [Aetokthonos hydrillicola Thurmond2011]
MNTVLVVEDGLADREIISQYLQQAGYFVISAKSGEEAEEKLQKNKPNVIFLDVILPGQSGFEMCRELKKNPQTSKIPIVICSTKNSDADKMWGKMLGADAYLSKPINQTELISTLNQIIK